MESMKQIVIPIGKKHRVLVDEYNHTLQVEKPDTKKGWKNLGYYNNFAGIVNRLSMVAEIDAGEYEAMQYANTVVDKAVELCEELKEKGLR
jgi:hypothetical protein